MEIRQCKSLGWSYFCQTDNIIDSLFVFSFFFSFLCNSIWGTDFEKNENAAYTRIGLAELLLIGFVKGINQMRAITSFSFIARLIGKVILDIVPFMVLFILFTVVTAMCMHVLSVHLNVYESETPEGEETVYTGLGIFGHFIFTLVNSNGEFDLEPISELKQKGNALFIFGWIFWIFLLFMNCIVFLNFVIALITDVYVEVMKTKEEEQFKKKAELISEYIQLELTHYKDIYRKSFWPSILMHRSKRDYDETENQVLDEIKKAKIET